MKNNHSAESSCSSKRNAVIMDAKIAHTHCAKSAMTLDGFGRMS